MSKACIVIGIIVAIAAIGILTVESVKYFQQPSSTFDEWGRRVIPFKGKCDGQIISIVAGTEPTESGYGVKPVVTEQCFKSVERDWEADWPDVKEAANPVVLAKLEAEGWTIDSKGFAVEVN
jgi:hypothetical protein